MAAGKSKGEVAVEVTGDSAKLRAEFAKVGKTLKEFQTDVKKVRSIAEISFNFTALKKSIQLLKSFGSELKSLVAEGEKAGSIRDAFEGMGGKQSNIDAASKSILGLVSSFDLMANANKGLMALIPGFQDSFAKVADLGARWADSLGKDAKQGVEFLTDAIVKGRTKALEPLGFAFTQTKDKAVVAKEALAQLEKVLRNYVPLGDSVDNALTSISNTFGDMMKNVGSTVNENVALIQSLRDFEIALTQIDLKQFSDSLATIAKTFVDLGTNILPDVVDLINAFARGLDLVTDGSRVAEIVNIGREIENVQKQLKDSQAGKEGFLGGLITWEGVDTTWAENRIKELEQQRLDLINTAKVEEQKANEETEKKKAALAKQQQEEEARRRAQFEENQRIKNSEAERKAAEKKAKEEAKDIERMAEKLADEQKKAYEDSIAFWESTFENAITGVTFNLSDALEQVAVGFAAQIMASLTGLSFQGGIKGIGVQLAQGLLGGGPTGGNSLMNTLGIGSSLLGGTQVGGFISGLGGTVGPVASGAEYSGMLAGSEMAATIAPAMPYIAAAVGTYMVAKHFGLFGSGPTNPETLARFDAQDKINQMTGRNLDFGPSNRFNPGQGGFDFFNQMGTEGKNSFGGLGTALQELLGLTEDVGPQIGAILSEELSGNLDEAKKLTRELGFSMEEMKAAVIKAGLAMGKTWLEIQGQLQGIDDMFTPGRSGKGDIAGAFQSIIDSGGEGTGVLVDIRDAAIEAGEAGITSFEGLAAELKKTFSESNVNIFFQTISDMGITNLDQLKNASDEMAIAFVAHLDALGFGFAELKDNIDAATDSINELNDAASDTPVTGSSTTSSGTTVKKNARGGIINTRTMFGYGGKLGLMGEMGPEAILPLTRVGGKLGVAARLGDNKTGSGMTFVIDARGAAPGVEHQIERAMRAMQSEIMRDTARLIHRSNFDGGRVRGFE